MQTDEQGGFFKHENGACICTVCGRSAPSATQIAHEDNCPVKSLVTKHMQLTVEERLEMLEHVVLELDAKFSTIHTVMKSLCEALTAIDAQR